MISVIIPAYQAEKTIEKCLNSILSNNSVLEVIIVNDGSLDNTSLICRELEQKDSRIQYYEKENEGPGIARKYGLERASGEYVTFVDADDYLLPKAYDILLKVAPVDTDIIEFNYCSVNISGERINTSSMVAAEYRLEECAKHFAKQDNTTNFLWNKLYKKTMFENIVFLNLFAGEDALVLTQLYGKAKKCINMEDVLYMYVQTEDSLCRSKFNEKKWIILRHIHIFANIMRSIFLNYVYIRIISCVRKLSYCIVSVLIQR